MIRFFCWFIVILALVHRALTMVIRCETDGDYFMPHPKSCSSYFRCQNGTLARSECSFFTFFDRVTKRCQWWWVIDCNAIPPGFPPKHWKPDK